MTSIARGCFLVGLVLAGCVSEPVRTEIRLEHVPAQNTADVLAALFPDLCVHAAPSRNVILLGESDEAEEVARIVRKLDRRRPQVITGPHVIKVRTTELERLAEKRGSRCASCGRLRTLLE